MSNDHSAYWATFYAKLARDNPQLDYSNARVQAQTYGLILEATGGVAGKSVLDLGCGWGQLALLAHVLGARRVVGVDLVDETIRALTTRHPMIDWRCGSVADANVLDGLGGFDIVFANEVIQYVPHRATVELAWARVGRGGRLILVVPNRHCPIVEKVVGRWSGEYAPPTGEELADIAESLPDIELWKLRGLRFEADQRIAPYAMTAWGETIPSQPPSNRLQLIVVRKAA